MTHHRRLAKPDGRAVHLYADAPIPDSGAAPVPPGEPVDARPSLRWHPYREEWVAYAGHRQERTFLPPPDYDPLAPAAPGAAPTELPGGPWQIAVFENRFPTFAPGAPEPEPSIVETRPGRGVCEVVVYTQERAGGIGDLPPRRVAMLLEVWADRTAELGARDEIQYVMPFENRGVEVGATLHHPHGQIYAYPFVPPLPAIELEAERRHRQLHGKGLLETHLEEELRDGRRILYAGERAIAFVPAFARYPYEVWIATRAPVPSLPALDARGRADFAAALRHVVRVYDRIREAPFPYVMVIHQAPTDGADHAEAHLHAEFYPPYRTRDRLKYLAGTEIGAGTFTNDALPEAKAAEMQALADPVSHPVP